MDELKDIIERSRIGFLTRVEFEKVSEGRYFQKEKIIMGSGFDQFYVILLPNAESPIHNHTEDRIEETHLLLYGSGKFEIYDDKGDVIRELELKRGEFHEVFSNRERHPNHKFIAGPEGSICLALERHY